MNHKNLDTSKLNYVAYCRRSSEDGEDKQVQSLETQFRELTEHATRNNLNVVETISESKSAHSTGREGFKRMMKLISTGKANAILVIRANRISRNPIDAGYTISLMDEKKLLYIRTPNATCYTSSSSDKMMIAFELIFSKKDSDDKSDMVMEGQKTKALKGLPHGVATLGFLNDKTGDVGNRKWLVDRPRLGLIKILLDKFLTRTYSAGKLYKHAVEDLKLTTVVRKRSGGKLIAPSRIYEILTDPVYAGFFFYGGERYELDPKLPRLITEAQHIEIRNILSGKNIPKTQHHQATYSGFFNTEEGNFMGQDVKFQIICDCKHKFAYKNRTHCPQCGTEISKMENPKYLSYTWYYDVKSKKNKLPYKHISEKNVDQVVHDGLVEQISFSSDVVEWSKKYIHEMKDKEVSERLIISQRKEERKEEYKEKKAKTRAMLRDNKITEEDYKDDMKRLDSEYVNTKDSDGQIDWYGRMMGIVDITAHLEKVFAGDDAQAKREILATLGSNLVLKDGKPIVINKKEIDILIAGVKRSISTYPEFEPKKYIDIKGLNEKTSHYVLAFSILLRE